MVDDDDRKLLTEMFDAAVSAADPKTAMKGYLPNRPKGRTVVIGAGKGAAQMAAAFEALWDGPVEGVVVTRYGYAAPTQRIRVLEAAHPVPDDAGLTATRVLFDAVRGLTKDDLVVALICGGGSSLLPCPAEGLTFEDEKSLNKALLMSGAPISAMNAVRKQVSGIKGGRLAIAAHPAPVCSLVVSDVPGDDPAQVASGPTIPDAAGRKAALDYVSNYNIRLPASVSAFLATDRNPCPHPEDAVFQKNTVSVIASAAISLEAAARVAQSYGINAAILSDAIEGEARDVGMVHAAIAKQIRQKNVPFNSPVILLSGGETTVTIREAGWRGGRNTEFLLAFAEGIEGHKISALAADTDGIDGSESNAGAFADGTTWSSLRQAGLDPRNTLTKHDSWHAFDVLNDLFIPGPTGTNVNDFRAILIR